MDLIALWVGRIVMGLGAGLFVIGGLLILTDHYGRMLWNRLKAAHDIKAVYDFAKTLKRNKNRSPIDADYMPTADES